ncbi:MAG: ABC transporter ATP-binding protein, partial [Candidatus Zixiibacteriota bacterium]
MRDKIRWLWSFYRHYPYILLVLLLLTPVQAAFQVIIPRLFGYAVDFTQTGQVSGDRLAQLITRLGDRLALSPQSTFGLAFIVIGLIATVMYAWMQTHRAWMNVKLEWLFRQQAFDCVTDKGPDFFTHFRTGDLVTRLTDDVAEKLSWFACSGIFRLYEAIFAVLFIVVMMIS